MINRKFLMEGALELYSSGANVIQPTDLYHLSKDDEIREALEGCNLYLITRRKRISVASDSLRVIGNRVYGDFLVQNGLDQERYPFKVVDELSQNVVDINIPDYPQNCVYFRSVYGEETKFSVINFMQQCEYDLDEHDDLEVLYVGKGYGKEGERLALDRLQEHSTLQRILADTLHEKPDHEIQLLLFRYEHYKKNASSEGDFSVEPTATDSENYDYFSSVMDAKFTRKNRVLLAEAGLIRYFEPEYNKIYKKTFPSKKHKVLEELLELDFSGLTVQVDTQNIRTYLYSDKVGGRVKNYSEFLPHIHIAKIPLYSTEERESFLHSYL